MKRLLFIFVSVMLFMMTFAQETSTVYLIVKKSALDNISMSVNGGQFYDFTGNLMKLGQISPAYQIVTVEGEGKIIIYVKAAFTPFKNSLLMSPGKQKQYACEYQLNVECGDTYYLYMTNKGIDDIKLEEINKKKADKIMNHKKVKVVTPIKISLNE